MRRIRVLGILVALAAAMIGITVARSTAAPIAVPIQTTTNVYAAKFLCGEFDKLADPRYPAVVEGPVKPGNYQTVINLHNPQFSPVTLQKKAVLLFAGDRSMPATEFEVPKRPSRLITLTLPSDWGLYIDCQDIRKVLLTDPALPPPPPAPIFIEGWVVLYSPSRIDVEGVYTSYTYRMDPSIGGLTRTGFDTEMERVQPTVVSTGSIRTP